MKPAILKSLYRYPVKGLSPQALQRTILTPGQTVPGDRGYAIENGPTGFDPAAPAYFPKSRFLMLMRNERLAALRADYDETSQTLVIHAEGSEAARGDLNTPEGRLSIETFFAAYCANELRGPPKILSGDGHSFSDVAQKVVSIIGLASIAEVEKAAGFPVHPLRFRGNMYVEGWPAWHEFDLMGRELTIGEAKLRIIKRIRRCAATDVDPETGIRDLTIPNTLMKAFGHADCGVYAEVINGGIIAAGEAITVTP